MVQIGNKKVIFSASFLMARDQDNSATFSIPGDSLPEFNFQVKQKPVDFTEYTHARWHDFGLTDGKLVLCFDVLPEGPAAYWGTVFSNGDKGRHMHVVRQPIVGNYNMLVHVIVTEGPQQDS
jgi:hypothetical protein